MTEPILRIVCAWCQRVLAEGSVGAPISHGCCPTCVAVLNAELDAA